MREEEKRGLVYIIVWLVGLFVWFVCLLVFLKFIFNFFFLEKFSLFLKFWRKTWKHVFISVFYQKKKTMEKVFFYLV
jgi:hypothetical protein